MNLGLYRDGYQLDSENDEKPEEKYLPKSPDGLRYPIVIYRDRNVPLEKIFAHINLKYAKNLSVTIVTEFSVKLAEQKLVRKFANVF